VNWLDIVIIYLACGTPFAVYRVALSEYGANETLVRSLRAALLWPIVGAKTVAKRIYLASRALRRLGLEAIRVEMETLLSANVTNFEIFAFRELFERYSGLAHALDLPGEPPAAELLSVNGCGESETAKVCLVRTNQTKIARHLAAARSDLKGYLRRDPSPRLLELAALLAKEVCDDQLTSELLVDGASTTTAAPVRIARFSGSAS
jgi:hypothetical protein